MRAVFFIERWVAAVTCAAVVAWLGAASIGFAQGRTSPRGADAGVGAFAGATADATFNAGRDAVADAAADSVADAAVDAPDAATTASNDNALVPPRQLQRPRPVYPATGDGRSVHVEMVLTIDASGAVSQVEVLGHVPSDADEGFDRAARDAARAIVFQPATRGGQPIPVRLRYHMVIAPALVRSGADTASGDGGTAPGDGGAPTAAVDGGAPGEPLENDEPGLGAEGIVHAHTGGHAADHRHVGELADARQAADADSRRGASASDASASTGDAATTTGGDESSQGTTVRGSPNRGRSATEFVLPVGSLSQVPRQNGGELLTLAPGVMLSNEGGEGHAQHVFLRGFTGENGQDIAFSVDGVPLNEESNTHGQGYVDLNFLLPELVQRLDVTEGVADPRQGNFAVAGSINYHLGLRERGMLLRGTLGMFGYRRLLAAYGPTGAPEETFAGVELAHSDGFGPARGFDRATGLGQWRVDLGAGVFMRLMAALYTTRWTAPGLVREDDFQAGRVGFFDTYAGLGRQGGNSQRGLAVLAFDWRRERERAEMRVFGGVRDLGLLENFTGYVLRRNEGDLIEQRYGGGTFGLNGYYVRELPLFGRWHDLEVGWSFRHDRYALAQYRLDALTNARTEFHDPSDIDANVRATQGGAYVDAVARVHSRFTLRGGVRLDAIGYDIDANVFRNVDRRTVASHRTTLGFHVGPKATAEVHITEGLTALASVGTGFRSPDALSLADGEPAPFTSVLAEELGVRFAMPASWSRTMRLSATLAGYHTHVASDLLFDPTAGRNVPIGSTERWGAVLWARWQPLAWIDLNTSLTFTRATVDTDALGRTIAAGSLLPYVPPWVFRLDAAVDREVARWRGQGIRVRGGLGGSFVSARPLPLNDRSDPVFIVDASAGVRVGPFEVGLIVRNLFDARWRDAQLNLASNYVQGAIASLFPTRHFTAGAPFTLMGTFGVQL